VRNRIVDTHPLAEFRDERKRLEREEYDKQMAYLRELHSEARKVDDLLSEEGWKTIGNLLNTLLSTKKMEAMKEFMPQKKRTEAIAHVNVLKDIMSLIFGMRNKRINAEKRMKDLNEVFFNDDKAPTDLHGFNESLGGDYYAS